MNLVVQFLPAVQRAIIGTVMLIVVGGGLMSCSSDDNTSSNPDTVIRTVEVVSGLSSPWSLAFLPDGRMLVTERPGNLRIVDTQGNISAPIAGVPTVATSGQGGLLDVQLASDFASNPQIFFSYSESTNDGRSRTAVARADYTDTSLENLQVIYRQEPAVATDSHFGSRLAFDTSGHLIITLGDRGQRDNAQLIDNTLGKVVRIQTDGTVPVDNPFVGNGAARPELFTYGHRNPQGVTRHPQTGEIWVHEHGPLGGDEINRLTPGENYGWPRVTYGREYDSGAQIGEGTTANDVQPPVHYWVPVSVAPAGMVFYTGNQVPALTGKLLVGAMAAKALISLTISNNQVSDEQQLITELDERIRDVRQGLDGYPYVLTDSGKILRIEATD
jgi:glucose/arabinose dehydrogenase